MMRRFLIIDDHPTVQEGLRAILTARIPGLECEAVGSAGEALQKVEHDSWHVISLDISIPGRSGPELIQEIKRRQPGARILVYTVHPEDQFGVRSLQAGADGYLTKDRPMDELIHAVQTLLAGNRYISNALAQVLADAVTLPPEPHRLLSERELQVLRLLVTGVNPKEISDRLNLSIKTVSTYRARVLEKLHLSSTADLVRYAIQHHLE
jgi:two-component system, NarL family, invasion response regulator UvrY